MLIYMFLLVAIAVMAYLIQFILFSRSRNKVLGKDIPVIIGPTFKMNLSAGTKAAEV